MTGRAAGLRMDSATSKAWGICPGAGLDRAARRVIVLGCPGSGKTTLSWQLAATLRLPHVKLDDLYWQAGWRRPAEQAFLARLDAAVGEPAWLIDGNYRRCLGVRLSRADTVVFLDLPTWRCATRALVRGWRRARGERASLPAAVADSGDRRGRRLDWRFWALILGFRRRVVPAMLDEIGAHTGIRLVVLHTPDDVAAFLAATKRRCR